MTSQAVLAEHLEYLTLSGRLDLYRRALARCVKPGDVVADLGCGLGVIGIEALKAGAARAYGIDQSDAIELARETISQAGLSDRYHCLRGSTFQTILPEPVDVLVCDHVGYFGFDYGIVAMLADARKRMLRSGGTVMPRRLRLSMATVEAPRTRKPVDSWANGDMQPEQAWLREYAANSKHNFRILNSEVCSTPATLGEIDLTSDTPDSLAFNATLVATRDCRVDGVAGWFECELAEGVWMTNSPLAADSIGRSNAFFACRDPFTMKAGEELALSLRIRHEDHIISWTLRPPHGAPVQKMSTWNSHIFHPGDLETRRDEPLTLTSRGSARRTVLALVDGQRTLTQIEDIVLRDYPALFPTVEETRRFVRAQLTGDATA